MGGGFAERETVLLDYLAGGQTTAVLAAGEHWFASLGLRRWKAFVQTTMQHTVASFTRCHIRGESAAQPCCCC